MNFVFLCKGDKTWDDIIIIISEQFSATDMNYWVIMTSMEVEQLRNKKKSNKIMLKLRPTKPSPSLPPPWVCRPVGPCRSGCRRAATAPSAAGSGCLRPRGGSRPPHRRPPAHPRAERWASCTGKTHVCGRRENVLNALFTWKLKMNNQIIL